MMINSWLVRWAPENVARPSLTSGQGGLAVGVEGCPLIEAVCDGYLFERERLPDGARRSEAEAVARAYQRWGERLFDELRGGFALAIWDGANRRLLAGRDALGLHPLYYHWNGQLILLSPDLDLLLAQPEIDRNFNRVVLAEYLQNIWHAHQQAETFYEEIHRVPAAHRLCLRNGSLLVERYWDPIPPGFQWADQEELESFEPLLEQAVGRCLSVGADSLALSGGFDSISIAILAARQSRGNRPLHAVSLWLSPNEVDESTTQIAVARALGMPHILRKFEECLDGQLYAEASLAQSRSSPTPVLSQWQAIYTGLLRSAAVQGLNKIMMGTGGDEMFTVDLAYGADRLAALDFRGLWRFYRAMQRTSPFTALKVARVVFWNEAAKPALLRTSSAKLDRVAPGLKAKLRRNLLEPKPWISHSNQGLREVLAQRRSSLVPTELSPGEGEYVRKIRGLLQAPLLMTEMEQGFSWARQAGFGILFPFFDQDLVALALRMQPEYLLSGGLSKTPLRRLNAERLTEVNIPIKKVDFTRPVKDLLRNYGREIWQKLDGADRLAALGIIDPRRLTGHIDGYFDRRNNHWNLTWQVLSAETWLRARTS